MLLVYSSELKGHIIYLLFIQTVRLF